MNQTLVKARAYLLALLATLLLLSSFIFLGRDTKTDCRNDWLVRNVQWGWVCESPSDN